MGFQLYRSSDVPRPPDTGNAFLDQWLQSIVGNLTPNQIVFDIRDFDAVLDGVTSDVTAINAAVDALPDSGGVILITGPMAIDDGFTVSNKSGGAVVGIGPNARIIATAKSSQAAVPGTGGSAMLSLSTCTAFDLYNLQLEGGGFDHNGIGMQGCVNCTIKNNRVSNVGHLAGIMSFGGRRNKFVLNDVSNTITASADAARGIWVGNTGAGELEYETIINSNSISSCDATGIICTAVGATVGNNSVKSTNGSGIIVSGAATGSAKEVTISGNHCSSNSFHGIQCDVSGNANFVEGVSVVGNVCTENTISGILAARARNWSIIGNTCVDNGTGPVGGRGIQAELAKNITLIGNTCFDSRAIGSKTQIDGIRVQEQNSAFTTERITIVGNHLSNNSSNGLFVTTASGTTISDVLITGNSCISNGQRGIRAASATTNSIMSLTIAINHTLDNPNDDLLVSSNISYDRIHPNNVEYPGIQTVGASNKFEALQITDADSPYSPTADDYLINCDASSATITINLPSEADSHRRAFAIKKIDTGAFGVVIDPASGDAIEGGVNSTRTILTPLESLVLRSDAAGWWIESSHS